MTHETRSELEARLARLDAVHDEDAVDRAVAAAERMRRQRRNRRRALAGAALAGVAALIISPAGGALAGAAGDLLGIGEQPSRTDEIDSQAAFPPARDQRVIATGLTPDGLDYEVIATASRYDIPLSVGQRFGMCVDIDVPTIPGNSSRTYWPVSCANEESYADPGQVTLEVESARRDLSPSAALTASAWLPLNVESVAVTYTDGAGEVHDVPVALGRVEGELAKAIKAPVEAAFFAALIPADVFGPEVQADGLLNSCEVRAALKGISATVSYSDEEAPRALTPDMRYETAIASMPPPLLSRERSALDAMDTSDCGGGPYAPR